MSTFNHRNPAKAVATKLATSLADRKAFLADYPDIKILDSDWRGTHHPHRYLRKSTGYEFSARLYALKIGIDILGLKPQRGTKSKKAEYEQRLADKFGHPVRIVEEKFGFSDLVTLKWRGGSRIVSMRAALYELTYLNPESRKLTAAETHSSLLASKWADLELVTYRGYLDQNTYRRKSTGLEFEASGTTAITYGAPTLGYPEGFLEGERVAAVQAKVRKAGCKVQVVAIESGNYVLLNGPCCPGKTWRQRLDSVLRHKVSKCPECSKAVRTSKVAERWLKKVERTFKIKLEREFRFTYPFEGRTKSVRVDGYHVASNTVFEFYGDAYHGNPEIHKPSDRIHPYDKKVTAKHLYQRDKRREAALVKYHGVNFVCMREHDWHHFQRRWIDQWRPLIKNFLGQIDGK